MRNLSAFLVSLALTVMLLGCGSQDIPPAHKGRLFDKTGALALYAGGKGFEGPILGPGTHFTGIYPEVRMIECAQRTTRESLTALTKDGVQFILDIYVSFGANCDDEKAILALLEKIAPEGKVAPSKDEKKDEGGESKADPALTVTADQLYRVFLRPALGEAVREAVSPHIANEINAKREEIFGKVKETFQLNLNRQQPRLIHTYELNLSNLDFPDTMDQANVERAAQSILKDKAIAERDRVQAEIETSTMRRKLSEADASNEAAKIRILGQALRDFPEYNINDIYSSAGAKGNLIVVPAGTPLVAPSLKK